MNVPFLNLMSLIAQKAGAVHVRVGGNTQETAFLVDSFPDGGILEKDNGDKSNPVRDLLRSLARYLVSDVLQTGTPVLAFTPDLIYMLGNVSSLVNVKWYLGAHLSSRYSTGTWLTQKL